MDSLCIRINSIRAKESESARARATLNEWRSEKMQYAIRCDVYEINISNFAQVIRSVLLCKCVCVFCHDVYFLHIFFRVVICRMGFFSLLSWFSSGVSLTDSSTLFQSCCFCSCALSQCEHVCVCMWTTVLCCLCKTFSLITWNWFLQTSYVYFCFEFPLFTTISTRQTMCLSITPCRWSAVVYYWLYSMQNKLCPF